MSALIQLSNVDKSYCLNGRTVPVLENISLQLYRGEFVALVGRSGSGKSTLMNIIGLLDSCDQGDYLFDGQSVLQLSQMALAAIRNHKIGFIFQSFYLLPKFTALENVMLPLHYANVPLAIAKQRAEQMLARVEMSSYITAKPNQLSGGQQQRVAIARALVNKPSLILGDEPTGALDSKTGFAIMDLLATVNKKEKCTILLVTHDYTFAQNCGRILTMNDGFLQE